MNMKRPLTLLLASLMTLSALAACGGDTDTPADTTAPADTTTAVTTPAETELTDGLADVDMDGFEFKIFHSHPETLNWAEVRLDATIDETGDVLSEAIYKRSEMLKERFNATLSVSDAKKHPVVVQTYINLITAGDNSVDIGLIYGIQMPNVFAYVADFAQVPHISLGEAWWTPNASAPFYLGDKQAGAAGAFSLAYVSTANLYAFNKDIYKDMNTGEDLYDIVREGKWTLDKFFTLSAAAVHDVDGDGVIGPNDRNGFTASGFPAAHSMLTVGSGVRYITKGADNFPVYEMNTDDKAIDVLEKIVDFHITNPSAYDWPEAIGKGKADKFLKGLALLAQATPKSLETFREMEDEFGVIPAPKYDEAQENYYSSMSNGELSTLPRSFSQDRLENIGILLEAMSFYTYWEIFPVYKDVVLDLKVTRDMDSAEMLDIIFEGATYDLGINVWHTELNNEINTDIFWARNNAIVSYLTSIKPTMEKTIQSVKETIEAMP